MRLGFKYSPGPKVRMSLGGCVQVRGPPHQPKSPKALEKCHRNFPPLHKGVTEARLPWLEGVLSQHSEVPDSGPTRTPNQKSRRSASWSNQCLRHPQGGSVTTQRTSEGRATKCLPSFRGSSVPTGSTLSFLELF